MDKLLGENISRKFVSATTSTALRCDHVFHHYIEVDESLVRVIEHSCRPIHCSNPNILSL